MSDQGFVSEARDTKLGGRPPEWSFRVLARWKDSFTVESRHRSGTTRDVTIRFYLEKGEVKPYFSTRRERYGSEETQICKQALNAVRRAYASGRLMLDQQGVGESPTASGRVLDPTENGPSRENSQRSTVLGYDDT